MAILLVLSCAPKAPRAAATAAAKAADPHRVTVAFAEGDAKINGVPAVIGQDVALKSIIETGPASRCDLVFDDRNALGVGQNSLMELDSTTLQIGLRVEKGGVTSVLKKLSKLADKDSFTISTSNAIAGVRGTSFCLWVDADSTYVCACNGDVHTIDTKGTNAIDLSSPHHSARIYTTKDGATTMDVAGMLHHSDESVQSVASRIGYLIDWTKTDH